MNPKPISQTDLTYLTQRLMREHGAPPDIAAQMVQEAQALKATNLYKVALSHYRSYLKRQARNPATAAITAVKTESTESIPVIEAEPVVAAPPAPLRIIEWKEEENHPAGDFLRVLLPEGGFMMVRNPTAEQIALWDAEYDAMEQRRLANRKQAERDTAAHAREVCSRLAQVARRRAEQEKGESTP